MLKVGRVCDTTRASVIRALRSGAVPPLSFFHSPPCIAGKRKAYRRYDGSVITAHRLQIGRLDYPPASFRESLNISGSTNHLHAFSLPRGSVRILSLDTILGEYLPQ